MIINYETERMKGIFPKGLGVPYNDFVNREDAEKIILPLDAPDWTLYYLSEYLEKLFWELGAGSSTGVSEIYVTGFALSKTTVAQPKERWEIVAQIKIEYLIPDKAPKRIMRIAWRDWGWFEEPFAWSDEDRFPSGLKDLYDGVDSNGQQNDLFNTPGIKAIRLSMLNMTSLAALVFKMKEVESLSNTWTYLDSLAIKDDEIIACVRYGGFHHRYFTYKPEEEAWK